MRLIDADALAKEFKRMQDCDPNDNHYMGYASHFLNSGQEPSTEWDCVENALENAPTIDAIPVEWLRNEAKLLIESEDGFDKYIGETLKAAVKYWNLKNEGTIGKWQNEQEAKT